jgi:arylsulfatase A-like enzyme
VNKILQLYTELLKPWLTVVVYLWMLELLACFAINDPEPLFDRIADLGAILVTLAFWTCLAVLLPWFLALVLPNRKIILSFNDFLVKAAIILITAWFFIRWLLNWATLLGSDNAIGYILVIIGVLMGAWAWHRRKKQVGGDQVNFHLTDGWCYCALPILTATAVLLAVKVATNVWNVQSPAGHHSRHRPNVLLLVADALRAQNMSLYGYSRKTTPFLDRFAERSNVYTQMHTNSTSTRTSLTTILSGKHPLSHGRLTKFLPVYDSPENFVAVLRDNGYATAAIASNSDATFYSLGMVKYLVKGEYPNFRRLTLSFLRDYGVYPTSPGSRMYDELARLFSFLGYPESTMGYGSASTTMKLVTQTVAKLPEPFFLFVHIHEPHDPYESPPPFTGMYSKLDYLQVNEKISSDYYGRYKPELQPYVDAHREHYDEAITYLDAELEKLLSFLDRTEKNRNLLLVFTGDHGESFERGFLNHGEDLYETSVHVPLVIKFPNQQKGIRLSEPVQSIDIAPTILETLGIPLPGWMDGVSLAKNRGFEAREKVIVNYKDPVGGKVYKQPTKLAIRRQQFKMIVNCDNNRAELYDLSRDPSEQSDLVPAKATIVKQLWTKLEQYLARQNGSARMECLFSPSA